MKILLITDEEWNDYVYANGVLTNWFSEFDAEFAQIYCSLGKPINQICKNYFQITDIQMFKSLFGGSEAGGVIKQNISSNLINADKENAQRKGIYGILKKISLWIHTPVLMVRDFIWCYGKYNTNALKEFVYNFNPDIVFCPRLITPKLMRLENLVATMTKAPFVAFTADDEASLKGISCSPLYWLRKYYIHKAFSKHISLYSKYLFFSEEQAKEYQEEYGGDTDVLLKCGDFDFASCMTKSVGEPIRMVYAGRLYCNRWKTLAEIGEALRILNKNMVRIVLDVYTTEQLTTIQSRVLNSENYINVKGRVTSSQLVEIYKKADIALHVESMDLKNRLRTRFSFSTKIIDLMSSSCAIMAICWEKHAGYQYLKEKDAAFCISTYGGILPQLQEIIENPALISVYAEKAYRCGKLYHNREVVHQQIKEIFNTIISKY